MRFTEHPVFFLGGPVRGGGNWQEKMCKVIRHMTPEATIAVPIRWDENSTLAQYFLPEDSDSVQIFPRQRDYEQHYIDLACVGYLRSCLIFWLPLQVEPRPPEDGPYGQDTYGEIGEARGRMMSNKNVRVVIGGEKGFYGLDMIQRNFTARLGYDFPIYKTMEDTAAAALEMSLRK